MKYITTLLLIAGFTLVSANSAFAESSGKKSGKAKHRAHKKSEQQLLAEDYRKGERDGEFRQDSDCSCRGSAYCSCAPTHNNGWGGNYGSYGWSRGGGWGGGYGAAGWSRSGWGGGSDIPTTGYSTRGR